MADFLTRSPAGGVVIAVNAKTFFQSIIPHAQWPQICTLIHLAGRSANAGLLNVDYLLEEFDLDGSTGTSNAPVVQDRRISSELPTGKHTYTGTTTEIPRMSSGSPRILWSAHVAPAQVGRIPMLDPSTGKPPMIRPGRIGVFSATLPAAVAGQVEAFNLEYSVLTVDGG